MKHPKKMPTDKEDTRNIFGLLSMEFHSEGWSCLGGSIPIKKNFFTIFLYYFRLFTTSYRDSVEIAAYSITFGCCYLRYLLLFSFYLFQWQRKLLNSRVLCKLCACVSVCVCMFGWVYCKYVGKRSTWCSDSKKKQIKWHRQRVMRP